MADFQNESKESKEALEQRLTEIFRRILPGDPAARAHRFLYGPRPPKRLLSIDAEYALNARRIEEEERIAMQIDGWDTKKYIG